MANAIRRLIYKILFGEGGDYMMAMLWAQQVMLGKKTYAQVPDKLKEQVADLLRDSGCENLITEE